jgi:hypothetical protein
VTDIQTFTKGKYLMALNAKEKEYTPSGKQPDPMEAGTYPTRLVQVIDLGVQEQRDFDGKEKPPAQEIMTTYEFVDEFLKDDDGNDLEDKPRWLSETFVLYNLDSELAKSTKRYLALDPTVELDGDWTALIGEPAMVTVVANPGKGKNAGKIFNKISATSSVRAKEAAKLPDLKNAGKVFDLSDTSTVDIFFTLPKWLQDRIKAGLEFEGSKMAKAIENFKQKEEKGEKKEDKKQQRKAAKEEDDEAPFDTDDDKTGDTGEDW